MTKMDIININVGGTVFSTRRSTLKNLPGTRLARLTTCAEEYIKDKDYFFFDRNAELFQAILDLYRHGNLHVPAHVCGGVIKREFEFWEIPLHKLSVCCLATLCKHDEAMQSLEQLDIAFAGHQGEKAVIQDPSVNSLQTIRRLLWLFLTSRNFSRAAQVFSLVFYLIASLSVMIFVLGTHEAFREPRGNQALQLPGSSQDVPDNQQELQNAANGTNDTIHILAKEINPKTLMFITTRMKAPLLRLDQICLLFFAVELFLRLFSCPSIKVFCKDILNLLDTVIVVALMTAFILEQTGSVSSSRVVFWFYVVCRSVVILRIVRLFRVTRDVGGLRVLILSVKLVIKELLLLGAFVLITVVFFSSVVYYAEYDEPQSAFRNIPITIWWSLITVTTVGYGDVTPSTYIGYIIASLFAVCGLILIAMPIAIVATAFSELSFLNRVRERRIDMENKTKLDKETASTNTIVNKIFIRGDE